MSQEITHPAQNTGLTFGKIGDLPVLQNFVLLIALSNMAVNIIRVIKILTGDVCGKNSIQKCKTNKWGGYASWYNENYNERFRGPELLCYSVMVYVHSRLYTAVVEDDQETINVWLTTNVILTAISLFPGAVFPSLFEDGLMQNDETLIGVLVMDFVQYGAIFEYRRMLNKGKPSNSTEAPMASSQKTIEV